MHPQYHLDLHHDRARARQRDAHQRRLRAEAPRRPSHEADFSGWREVLGMRLVRVGLRLGGGGASVIAVQGCSNTDGDR